MYNLEEGDVVRLRSGGPRLTIWGIRPGPTYTIYEVVWFSGYEVRRDSFAECELEPDVSVKKIKMPIDKP